MADERGYYPEGHHYVITTLEELEDHQVFRAYVFSHMLRNETRWRTFLRTKLETASGLLVTRERVGFTDLKTMTEIPMIDLSLLEILYGILTEMTFNRQIKNV